MSIAQNLETPVEPATKATNIATVEDSRKPLPLVRSDLDEYGLDPYVEQETKATNIATAEDSRKPLPLVRSDLDEYGLDPYEFRIYAHVVRRTGGKLNGKCFATQKKTADICKMSVRKVQYALKTLCEAGLLQKEERKGRTDIYRLTPTSAWKPKEELKEIRKRVKESKADEGKDS